MNHYDVTIRETLEVKMKVAANSREEAEQFARDQWKRGEVVLDASHFTGVAMSSFFACPRFPAGEWNVAVPASIAFVIPQRPLVRGNAP